MKKADAFFMGTQGGGEQSLMNQNSCFSIDCCPHPNPSLLLRKQYLSLRERYMSQRDKHCSRSDKYCLRSKREGLVHWIVNTP